MKFIYFGSSKFSKEILAGLWTSKLIPSLILTKPDKPKGRGLKFASTEVSLFAQSKHIPCIKPQSLKEYSLDNSLDREQADFFIVADYGKIIPESILSLPKIFAICVHPSFLPFYRGSTPIEQAIISGERQTGVTIFKINEKIDAGDIIIQKTISIEDDDNFFSLRYKLAQEGVQLLIEAIAKVKDNSYTLTPQDVNKATLTYKLKKTDGRIIWDNDAVKIHNFIRATLDWPTAYTYYNNLMLKVLATDVAEGMNPDSPGTVVDIDREGIYVATSKNTLKIKKLKPQGKKEMDAFSFVCGHRIKAGDKFG
ncbi:MAG: methionyl-tRNA formyltransferase [Omnitrophica bacterium]|nr:methionyl-tRNA formyltransferase [Candidatus Omnitrophota bacterium]